MILRLLALAALSLSACAAPVQAELKPYVANPVVTFMPLPGQGGRLPDTVRYVGGYALSAEGTSWFEGLSDLHVTADGQVTALSDLGQVALFAITPDFTPTPLRLMRLRDTSGREMTHRREADAEDMAVTADGVYVSFERQQKVWFYSAWGAAAQPVAVQGLPTFPNNEGMEGLTIVGEDLLIGVEAGGFWRCGLNGGQCQAIKGPTAPGFLYKLVSLEALPDGEGILALYRYFDPLTGVRNVLRLLRMEEGRLVNGGEILRIVPPFAVDNYEGVSAVKTASGYRLYLISDSLVAQGKPQLLIFDWTP